MKEIVSNLKKLYDPDCKVELCGVVLINDEIMAVTNTHSAPEKGFIIPAVFMVEHEEHIFATWHTQPDSTSNLSEEDYFGFLQWPQLHHFIVGVDGVRCFRVEGPLVIEVELD
jgi:proteasome lid subunit RPN8/RPN11